MSDTEKANRRTAHPVWQSDVAEHERGGPTKDWPAKLMHLPSVGGKTSTTWQYAEA